MRRGGSRRISPSCRSYCAAIRRGVCDEDIGDVRYGQIFTTQLSDRPHGHRRSYRPGRIWRIDLRVYFASRRRALISRLWASRRSSNEKKKNSAPQEDVHDEAVENFDVLVVSPALVVWGFFFELDSFRPVS